MLRNDLAAAMATPREALPFVALSRSGTLYAAHPWGPSLHRVQRCRARERDGEGSLSTTWVGRVLAVRACGGSPDLRQRSLPCRGRWFEPVPGDARPRPGERLAVGISGGVAAEVSSPLVWVAAIEAERAWVLEPIARAFRNGDPGWRRLVGEVPYELGDEGFDEQELAAAARDAFYQRHLARRAALREEHRCRLGHDVAPRIVLVSNDCLSEALADLGAAG